MAKPLRSPVVGYNHNVRYHGRIFHVQSEDSGPGIPRVFTHLFHEGTILVTRKHEYDISADEDLVRLEMQRLHKSVMKDLTRGEFDAKIAAFFAARGQPAILSDPPAVEQAPPPQAPVPVMVAPTQVGAHTAAASGAPGAVVVQGSGMVGGGGTPRGGSRPPMTRPPVPARVGAPIVKPGDLKRPPVVLSSSADGVVVQRNVVIGIGGQQGTPGPVRVPRIRPPVPYVVREGSYAPVTPPATAVTEGPAAGAPPSPPGASNGAHPGWDVAPVTSVDRRAALSPAGERDRDRSFGNELVSDKSLDEVILEYLSDDSEADES
ncbi:MAG TPA: hypothetical protein VMU50_13245 [Polyangia bacterium]|nr:hypothetical protein [Polyangia bacterium]